MALDLVERQGTVEHRFAQVLAGFPAIDVEAAAVAEAELGRLHFAAGHEQVVDLDAGAAGGEDHAALDGILEFADIAWPGVGKQGALGLVGEAAQLLAVDRASAWRGSAWPAAGCPACARAAAG
jgi:hypothetical protein